MYGDIRPAELRGADMPSAVGDLAFARQAVTYLRGRGFDLQSIVQCLHEELEIDLTTAESLAKPGLPT